jgi:hypothetical protein
MTDPRWKPKESSDYLQVSEELLALLWESEKRESSYFVLISFKSSAELRFGLNSNGFFMLLNI